jgi:hypothetical protein
MRDFTIPQYEKLLEALIKRGYKSVTSSEYMDRPKDSMNERIILLRHDVDKKCSSTLKLAQRESQNDLNAIYYFRKVNGRFDWETVHRIAELNHEIGYHYEVLARTRGDYHKAIQLFSEELEELRRFVPVSTVCMHGSPMRRWDNRRLWEIYDYHKFGIQFEPYFDVDFNRVLYLSDTGRRWNGDEFRIRDKVETKFRYQFKTTSDIIEALEEDILPARLMINCHPHRWNDRWLPWLRELIWQNIKNQGKMLLVKLPLIK